MTSQKNESVKNIIKKRIGILIPLLISGMMLWMHFHYEADMPDGSLILGVPDDAGGLVVDYLINEKNFPVKQEDVYGIHTLRDCCSSTAEWALSGNRMHMAIVCPDAAQRLIEKDPRYQIVGPVLANSDMLVKHPSKSVKKIGITQNRWYQKEIIEKQFGEEVEVAAMLPAALPYAYEMGEVQGIVVDITQGIYLPGEHLPGYKKSERITYVLIARDGIMETQEAQFFLELWQEAMDELKDMETLQTAIDHYMKKEKTGKETTGKEAEQWMNLGMKLMNPMEK
ncbi:ABC transporter substrate-binding (seleno)protein SaoB [Tindallia californiensis]|uniref:Uncharacterized protein n=1 Tax=Tindallia californiensis TaxID=159292 RepID=A0A1H3Q2J8_9FIRM|nr:ABC transporter substrate-binding (seleno)protein SaoB [Tindallia californiensis]SDZ07391.1 hypothetical protein SAMN05192546_10824 [Tindallia californiensis]